MDGRTHFADDATLEYISKIERDLAQCYLLAGADPSGGLKGEVDEDWRLAKLAVQEVEAIRKDNDRLEREVEELKAQHALVWDEAIQEAYDKVRKRFGLMEIAEVIRTIPNPYAPRTPHGTDEM